MTPSNFHPPTPDPALQPIAARLAQVALAEAEMIHVTAFPAHDAEQERWQETGPLFPADDDPVISFERTRGRR